MQVYLNVNFSQKFPRGCLSQVVLSCYNYYDGWRKRIILQVFTVRLKPAPLGKAANQRNKKYSDNVNVPCTLLMMMKNKKKKSEEQSLGEIISIIVIALLKETEKRWTHMV